jgi:glycosyltransferase involved in cell wall biosynthesis
MSPPQISLIVPVHNGAPWLDELFASLVAQSFSDFEMLFIDDASTDDSPRLLETFAARDPRVRVLTHAIEGGPQGGSVARNTGLAAARGEWIAYSDQDDLFHPDHLARLHELASAHELDVAVCNAAYFHQRPGDTTQLLINRPKPDGVVSGHEWLIACHANGEVISPTWITLTRRALVEEFGVRWAPGILQDDVVWTARLMLVARRVAYRPDVLYYHRENPDSITRTTDSRRMREHVESFARAATLLFDLAAPYPSAVAKVVYNIANDMGRAAMMKIARIPDRAERAAAFRALRAAGLFRVMRQVHAGSRFWRGAAREWVHAWLH